MTPHVFDPAAYAFSPFAIPTVATTVAMLVLGAIVLIREQGSRVSRLFCLTTITICLWLFSFSWMYCATDERVALWWAKAAYLGVPFIPTAIYHFTLAVLGMERAHRRFVWFSWLLSAAYVVTIVTTDLLIHDVRRYWWGYYPQYGWLSVPYLFFFFGLMVVSLWHYWEAYRYAALGTIYRRRTRALLVAFSIVYIGSFDYVAKYGIALYPFGYIPVTVFIVLLARVLWRYRLVDITPEIAAKSIISTMANPLVVLDDHGVIRIVNHAACHLFSKSEAELVGQPVTAAHPAFLTPAQLEELTRYERVQNYELTLPFDHETRVLSLSASLLHGQDHQPMAVICILTDITERNRAEEQLKRAHAQLQQSHEELKATHLQLIQAAKMESVGRLAAGVAHEVKNPLAIILQGVDYLSKALPHTGGNGPVDTVLHYTREAVRRADAVIRGLLDFSMPRALELAEDDLNTVIEQALLLVKHELDRARVTLCSQLREGLPPLSFDRNKMEQVFVNLFMNAIDAMPNGGVLTVRTFARSLSELDDQSGQLRREGFKMGDVVVIAEVEDTGRGVPEGLLDKIFDPFFTTKPTGKGTGLGLTVTRKIVDLHGGIIRARNVSERPGGGLKVTIALKPVLQVKGGERRWRKSASCSSMTK
jgi:PAS domain S-box-containing protein